MRHLILTFALFLSVQGRALADTIPFSWDPVTQDVLGNPVVGLIGYKLYLSLKPGVYTYPSAYIGKASTSAVVTVTTSGTHYAIVRAYNAVGDSANSNEVSFTLAIMPPGAPIKLKIPTP